jgi:AraC-like DNA-binding protein
VALQKDGAPGRTNGTHTAHSKRVIDILEWLTHPFLMKFEQIQCPDCKESYTRLSRWKFCPFCGNRRPGVQRPYCVSEVAALTGLSRQTVTRMFQAEKGVLILGRPRVETMHKTKRGYRSLRIPQCVYERVVAQLRVKAARR